jgi:DNA mismatch repair protein MSH5
MYNGEGQRIITVWRTADMLVLSDQLRHSFSKEQCELPHFEYVFILTSQRHINLNTLSSLQILQTESHPNTFNQGPGKTSSRAKEDFSLYGLFHQHLLTPQGKNRLRQYFLRPSVDLDVISERHKILDLLLLPANAIILQKMCSCLKKVKNMRPAMTNLHKGLSSGKGAFGSFKGTIWGTLLNVCHRLL